LQANANDARRMLKESQEKVNRDFEDRIHDLENANESLANTMIKE